MGHSTPRGRTLYSLYDILLGNPKCLAPFEKGVNAAHGIIENSFDMFTDQRCQVHDKIESKATAWGEEL